MQILSSSITCRTAFFCSYRCLTLNFMSFMDILKKYFSGQLSAQEESQVQEWLVKHGNDPEVEAAMNQIMSELEQPDYSLSSAAFAEVKTKLGLRKTRLGCIFRKVCVGVAYAAVITLLPILGALVYKHITPEVEWLELKVPYGQMRELTLADGTHMHLNAGSRITYPSRFNKDNRHVFIEGEVFAEVTKDPEKPFVITSGDVNVQVLGTTFNFKAYDNTECVELILLDGSVRMDICSNNRSKQLMLNPGEVVQFDRKSGEIDLKNINPFQYRGFHENGSMHFFNLRLSDIVSDLERYFGTNVVLLDETIADTRYFAWFTNNETLEQILQGINVDGKMKFYKKDGAIYISKK